MDDPSTITGATNKLNMLADFAKGSGRYRGGSLYYHEENKPTAADVGAVSKSGDTMTGALYINSGLQSRSLTINDNSSGANLRIVPQGDSERFTIDMYPASSGPYQVMEFKGSDRTVSFKQTVSCEANPVAASHLTRKDYVDSAIAAGDARQVSKTGDTMTGVLAVAANAQIGASANGGFGSPSITGLLNSFIEVVTPNNAEHNSAGGIVFHNRGTSTSALYYKNDNSDVGYFNFKSDDSTYDVRVNGNKVYHQGFKPTAADVGAAPAGFGLGGYGSGIGSVLGDTPLRRQSGFFQGSNIAGLPTSPSEWNYVFSQAHGNPSGFFGYLAISFDCTKAWIGGQAGGAQRGPHELVKQGDRFVANNAVGNDYNQCAIEVNGNTAIDSRPGIGFHMSNRFASTLHLWEAGDFRFHTQGLTSYAGIMTGNVNANDVYIRSDRRLKKNLVEVRDALRKVSSLTAYSYDKKQTLEATEYDKKEVGLIAQDVEQVLPEAVTRVVDSSNKDGTEILTLSNSALIALLVEAVKELSEKVKELEHGRT